MHQGMKNNITINTWSETLLCRSSNETYTIKEGNDLNSIKTHIYYF